MGYFCMVLVGVLDSMLLVSEMLVGRELFFSVMMYGVMLFWLFSVSENGMFCMVVVEFGLSDRLGFCIVNVYVLLIMVFVLLVVCMVKLKVLCVDGVFDSSLVLERVIFGGSCVVLVVQVYGDVLLVVLRVCVNVVLVVIVLRVVGLIMIDEVGGLMIIVICIVWLVVLENLKILLVVLMLLWLQFIYQLGLLMCRMVLLCCGRSGLFMMLLLVRKMLLFVYVVMLIVMLLLLGIWIVCGLYSSEVWVVCVVLGQNSVRQDSNEMKVSRCVECVVLERNDMIFFFQKNFIWMWNNIEVCVLIGVFLENLIFC